MSPNAIAVDGGMGMARAAPSQVFPQSFAPTGGMDHVLTTKILSRTIDANQGSECLYLVPALFPQDLR